MPRPPLLNDDELHALRDVAGLRSDDTQLRAAWRAYDRRVQAVLLICLAYVIVLLGFAPQVAAGLSPDPSVQQVFSDYFYLRGGLLLTFTLAGLWSWWRDVHVIVLQGMLAAIAVITLLIDAVLIYAPGSLDLASGVGMSLLARLMLIYLLSTNVWRRDELPPLSQRRLLCWPVLAPKGLRRRR